MQRQWRDATYWLASPGLLSLPSCRTHDYQPRDDTTHNGLGPPTLDHSLGKCLTAGSHGGISSTDDPSSLMTLACVKLTHKTSQYRHVYAYMRTHTHTHTHTHTRNFIKKSK